METFAISQLSSINSESQAARALISRGPEVPLVRNGHLIRIKVDENWNLEGKFERVPFLVTFQYEFN